MNSMQVAEFISSIFSPPITAAFTFLALLISERASNLLLLAIVSLTFGTAIPLAILYYLLRRGTIPDLYVSARKSRPVAFAGALLSYLLGGIGLLLAQAPPVVTAAMFCYLGNSLTLMLISYRWKISVHTSGIAGPAIALTYSLGVGAIALLCLTIPVGWARMRLGAHTLAQVATGALLTIAITWLQLKVYLVFL
jgi:membrane-associated phospholipid phosphatase